MRIAHLTDLHVERPPKLAELGNKRLLGAVNLYLMGRSRHFSAASQAAAVEAVLRLAPDHVVCTGDFTATATEAEFRASNQLLEPLRAAFPFHGIPGNHDVYTAESVGRYVTMVDPAHEPVRMVSLGPVALCLLDVCVPDWLSRGDADESLVRRLEAALGACAQPVILALHYPLRARNGEAYGPSTRAIRHAAAIEAAIEAHPNVVAVLHGHEHHGFRTVVGARAVPIYNPGASGYAYLPDKRRTAHFNVYEVDATGIVGVERYAFDGKAFVPEVGGAYASHG